MTVTFADALKKELCDHVNINEGTWREECWGLYTRTNICADCGTMFKVKRYKWFSEETIIE